jgi:hypothetical protein
MFFNNDTSFACGEAVGPFGQVGRLVTLLPAVWAHPFLVLKLCVGGRCLSWSHLQHGQVSGHTCRFGDSFFFGRW